MEDDDVSDVEELLDEMESALSSDLAAKHTFTRPPTQAPTKCDDKNKKFSLDNELDQMMADIIEDSDTDDEADTIPNNKPVSFPNKQLATEKKCFPCLLGGAIHARGLSTNTEQRSCDRLLCTKCDFRVVSFDDYHWSSDCDYFFFRNNAPDFSRLKAKLIKKKGSRAYACQCSWKSIREITDVCNLFDLKWRCSRH